MRFLPNVFKNRPGTARIQMKYTWLPKRLIDNSIVWFEYYFVYQVADSKGNFRKYFNFTGYQEQRYDEIVNDKIRYWFVINFGSQHQTAQYNFDTTINEFKKTQRELKEKKFHQQVENIVNGG